MEVINSRYLAHKALPSSIPRVSVSVLLLGDHDQAVEEAQIFAAMSLPGKRLIHNNITIRYYGYKK